MSLVLFLIFAIFPFASAESTAGSSAASPATQAVSTEIEHEKAVVGDALAKSKLKRCLVNNQDPVPQNVLDALKVFNLNNTTFKKWLGRSSSCGRANPTVCQLEKDLTQHANVLKNYVSSFDASTCLPLNTDELSDLCLFLHTWKDMSYVKGVKNHIQLKIAGQSDLVLQTPFSEGDFGLTSTWNLQRKGVVAASVRWRSADDLSATVYRKVKTQDIEKFEGRDVVRFNSRSETVKVPYSEIGYQMNASCSAESSDPRKVYYALTKKYGSDFANAGKGVAGEIGLGFVEGLQEGSVNIQNAAADIPAALKATWDLVSNKEVSYCEESKEGEIPPETCPNAYRCKDSKNGHWCIGTFTLVKMALGDKAEEISKQCISKTFNSKDPLSLGLNPSSFAQFASYQNCFNTEVAKQMGTAALDSVKKCFENSQETSKCLAKLGVSAALAATGVGIAGVASRGVAATAVSLQALVKAGKLTAQTAKVLTKAAELTAKGVVLSYDNLINDFPVDPAAQLNVLRELDELISKAASPEEKGMYQQARSILSQSRRQQPEVASVMSNSALSLQERVSRAEALLGRSLTDKQKEALEKAHNVGSERAGAGYYNYTAEELRQKTQFLSDAGFSIEERELLIRNGVAGFAAGVADRYNHIARHFPCERTPCSGVRDDAFALMNVVDERGRIKASHTVLPSNIALDDVLNELSKRGQLMCASLCDGKKIPVHITLNSKPYTFEIIYEKNGAIGTLYPVKGPGVIKASTEGTKVVLRKYEGGRWVHLREVPRAELSALQ